MAKRTPIQEAQDAVSTIATGVKFTTGQTMTEEAAQQIMDAVATVNQFLWDMDNMMNGRH